MFLKGIGSNDPLTQHILYRALLCFPDNPKMAFPPALRGLHSGDTLSKAYKQYQDL